MATILYGVCGEGSGHSSRTKVIAGHLVKKGHNVIILTRDRAYKYLSRYFKCRKIEGYNFVFKDNKADYLETVGNAILKMPNLLKSFRAITALISKLKPKIIFTDFEPLTALAANLYGIPLISIDNQHRLTNMKLKVPRRIKGEKILSEIVVKAMVPNASAFLVTTFFKGKALDNKTFLFPPILRKEVLELKPKKRDYILVYQTTSTNKRMLGELKQVKERFIVYGFDKKKIEENLEFKKFSERGFLRDLENCKAVITNGGFTLITESLYLGKPVLSEPILGQVEQIINAYYLKKLGYGRYVGQIKARAVKKFLKKLPKYEKKLKSYEKSNNSEILTKVNEIVGEYEADKKI